MNETQNRIILKLGTNVEDDNTHVGNFNMEGGTATSDLPKSQTLS